MKVKICGITNIEDALLCANLGVDAIGFIFYDQSKRYIKPKDVKKIINYLPPFLLKVGVFVNEAPDVINSIAIDVGLNIIQLHGDESPEYLNCINSPTIKAFRIDENFDYTIMEKYKNCSFLLDSFSKDEYGGTGLNFSWDQIPNEIRDKIILAGGVDEQNIEHIKKEINPYAVDISSSVEISPGKKDHNKLESLLKKINEIRK